MGYIVELTCRVEALSMISLLILMILLYLAVDVTCFTKVLAS